MKNDIINLLNTNKFHEALLKYHKDRIKTFNLSSQIQVIQIIDVSIHEAEKLSQMIKKMCEMLEISYIINKDKIIKYYDNT